MGVILQQNRGLLLAGTNLILWSLMLPSVHRLHQYYMITCSWLLLKYCLLFLFTWHCG